MAELVLSDVRLSVDESDILKGVTLTVPDRTVVVLVGPSGSGKTTLLRAVVGLAEPQAGTIRIGEQTVFDAASRIAVRVHKRAVGVTFASDALLPERTVFENLAFCARFGASGAGDIKTRIEMALHRVGAPELADRYPAQLSLVDKACVALARALLREPGVLLLDDPLAALESTARAEARVWLRQILTRLRVAVLVTTREPVEAMAIADHVAVINVGLIEQEGAPADVYNEPATVFAAEYMAQSNRLSGTLIENAGTRACIDIMGCPIGGITQTRAPIGTKATGVIRIERTRIGGGPGVNRLPMTLSTQMYVGDRWEVVFVREALTVRAYTSAPLRHESYHVEFPPDALWVF